LCLDGFQKNSKEQYLERETRLVSGVRPIEIYGISFLAGARKDLILDLFFECIKVHRRSANRHGGGESDISNGQTLGGVKIEDWRDISGSPSKTLGPRTVKISTTRFPADHKTAPLK
jgi:hypothetical protein